MKNVVSLLFEDVPKFKKLLISRLKYLEKLLRVLLSFENDDFLPFERASNLCLAFANAAT